MEMKNTDKKTSIQKTAEIEKTQRKSHKIPALPKAVYIFLRFLIKIPMVALLFFRNRKKSILKF